MRITVNGSFTQEGIKIFLKLMPFGSSPSFFTNLSLADLTVQWWQGFEWK